MKTRYFPSASLQMYTVSKFISTWENPSFTLIAGQKLAAIAAGEAYANMVEAIRRKNANEFSDADHAALMGVTKDITDVQRLEYRLNEIQKAHKVKEKPYIKHAKAPYKAQLAEISANSD